MRALRNVLASLSEGQNASLLLARYLKETKGEAEQEAGQKAREALFLSAQRALKDRDVLDLYKMAFESRQKALAEVSGVRTFKTKSRLIAGLGSSSVLETGLTLNPLYGTPMIPGSSVKGIAARIRNQVSHGEGTGSAANR